MRHWQFLALPTLSLVVLSVTAPAQIMAVPQATVNSTVTDSPSDSSNDATNESNNPVTPKSQVILQNYLMPSPVGYNGRIADEQLLRLYLPVQLFGVQNIFRIYQPIETVPLLPNGRDAGLGDTTVYDLALRKVKRFTLGAGPLLVLPVASHKNLGDGKWQAGAAGVVVTVREWGLAGTVITYQHSFSGYGSRPPAKSITVQPLVHYNFNKGYYLRSSGIWQLNYGNNHGKEIPIGLGIGKVWTLPNGTVMNFYVEPQHSVYRTGIGAPVWQILSAVTFQFPHKATGR